MGFNYLHCQKAAINTSNAGVEEAMNWLLSHMDDPGSYIHFTIRSFTGSNSWVSSPYWIRLQERFTWKFVLCTDIDAPISQETQNAEVSFDQSKLDTLVSFGFQEDVARKALRASVRSLCHSFLYILDNIILWLIMCFEVCWGCMHSTLKRSRDHNLLFSTLYRGAILRKRPTGSSVMMQLVHQIWMLLHQALQMSTPHYLMEEEVRFCYLLILSCYL